MPAQLLIRATTRGPWKKGMIVALKDTPCEWGRKETLPDFVILEITDATANGVYNYMSQWDVKFKTEILAQNDLGYRVKISIPSVIINNFGNNLWIRRARDWLIEEHNASIYSYDPDGYDAVVDIPKPADLQEIKNTLQDHFSSIVSPRKFRFDESDIDTIINLGGFVTQTKAQVIPKIKDPEA